MKVTAIIPAKGASRRLPHKNMMPFGDSTLLGHKIDQLQQCSRIDEIVVGSDDERILREAALHGADVRQRDAYHCDEQACPLRDRWRNLVSMVECDVVVWAHCTNPLCGPDHYDRAIEAYLASSVRGECDSLCSVTPVQRHAWRCGANGPEPANFDPWGDRHPFASELPPYFFQDGAIFIQPHRQMLANGYFYGRRPMLFEIGEPYGLDVDTERDLILARFLHAALRQEAAA